MKANVRILVNSREIIWNPAHSVKIAYQVPDCENLLSFFTKDTESWNGFWYLQTHTRDKREKNKQLWYPDKQVTK